MNKFELIQALKDATNLTKPEAADVVDIFFNGMADAMSKVIGSRSVDCAHFSLRNMMDIPGGIRKQGNGSR